MKKYRVKTDMFRSFKLNEIIVQFEGNPEHFAKIGAKLGDDGICKDFIEKNPELFEEVKEDWHWPGRYKPERNVPFWGVSAFSESGVYFYKSSLPCFIEHALSFGNCCKNEKEAMFVKRQHAAYLELIDKIRELNEGWRVDWSQLYSFEANIEHSSQPMRYAIVADLNKNKLLLKTIQLNNTRLVADELVLRSNRVFDDLIAELGEAKIKLALWGIEDE